MESREKNYGITGEPGHTERGPVAEEPVVEEAATREPMEELPEEGYREEHEDHRPLDYGVAVMGPREERTWSVLAHLSAFLNVFTLFLGPVAALIVWLIYRDRSRKVAFEALQSAAYQGAWLAILGVGWSLTILLTFVLVGFLLIPAMLILTVVPLVHMGYAAYRIGKGEEFRYPIVADLIENR